MASTGIRSGTSWRIEASCRSREFILCTLHNRTGQNKGEDNRVDGQSDRPELRGIACRAQNDRLAASTAEPDFKWKPCFVSAYSRALRTRSTLLREDDSPINPIRHALPLKSPRPPPISMLNSLSNRERTVASGT